MMNTAMLIGEAPCTKDLIEITDEDFKTVSISFYRCNFRDYRTGI